MTTALETEGRIFVTADTHFGQSDACARYDRPFADTTRMETAIIERCNAVVGPGDVLLHLGDFVGDCGRTQTKTGIAARIRERLHAGRIVLVRGNHDPDRRKFKDVFDDVRDLLDVKIDGAARRVFCSHYPMRSWRGGRHGSLHLYGHTHGRLEEIGRSTDVGVDCWNFQPILFDDLIGMLSARQVLALPLRRLQRQPGRAGFSE
ncbi:MAG: metallophosphoesterase [Planctomycetaceae bacterium]|nr:metallophosphoesterase [Planctomycetaceae bacterium]